MSKVAIVFWSATGNTETMANCIAEGAGAAAAIVPCAEMDAAKLNEYDVVASGCAIGVSASRRTAHSCSAKRVSSAMRLLTTTRRLHAASWALIWPTGKK